MKIITILLACVVLSGCATSFQAQRKALSKSYYNDSKITKEEYEKKLAEIEHAERLAWEKEREVERRRKASNKFIALCDNCGCRFRFSELDNEESRGYGNCPYCGSNQNLYQANQRSVNQARAMIQQAVLGQIISRATTPPPVPQYQPPTRYNVYKTGATVGQVGYIKEQTPGQPTKQYDIYRTGADAGQIGWVEER